jgi:hypothetical protein
MLRPYDLKQAVHSAVFEEGWPVRHGPISEADERLFHRVWSAPTGHEQLAYAVGLGKQNERAQFVNTGWVIKTFLGKAAVDRVPFAFVNVQNVAEPIARDFVPVYENAY